ncbi:MAG: preprotein translocase subunit SecG [Candidatus Aphodocola sp.]
MLTILMIISILLIIIVLLQSGKAESGNIITGGNADLFMNRKERGGELFITRLTYVLGIAFFVLCIILDM